MNPALDSASSPDSPPKGPSNLRLRVIWGAIAAAGLFGCTFAGPVTFGLFFAAVQAIMLKEFYRIMRAGGYKPAAAIGIVGGILIFGATAWGTSWMRPDNYTPSLYIGDQPIQSPPISDMVRHQHSIEVIGVLAAVVLAVLVGVSVVLLLRELAKWPSSQQPFANMSVALGGLFYVSVPMTLLILLAYGGGGYDPRRVFFLIFLIWAADTGAYFAGKNLGKHKLAPSISPGKTWEGWAGGALLTLAVGWSAGYFLPDIPLGHRLVAAGVVAVFGPLGDLAESMLKRSAGVKDSGTFLPGHGGLLDRFDAFLLVLPVLALLQVLAG